MAIDRESHAAAVALFMGVLDLSRAEAVAFADAGHTTVEELAYVPQDEFMRISGIAEPRIFQVRQRARKCMISGQSQ